MNSQTKKSVYWAIGGGLSLLVFYFLLLSLANSFAHALDQFKLLWYWILALVIGFSLQAGLYAYIRLQIKAKTKTLNKEMAASAVISGGSMVACCAHHLIDILPFLGLSAAFLFLVQYQVLFIILGILSNLIGIIYMLEIIKKHSFYQPAGRLNKITQFDIKTLKYRAIASSIIILLIVFVWIKNSQPQDSIAANIKLSTDNIKSEISKSAALPPQTDDQGGLSIEIEPIDFSFDQPIQFRVSLNTHQGDLDFDLTKKTTLVDNQNNQYLPLQWIGKQGGHHLSGILVFPAMQKTKTLKLIISDVYNIKEREFLWNL